jgi:hypothetical protein
MRQRLGWLFAIVTVAAGAVVLRMEHRAESAVPNSQAATSSQVKGTDAQGSDGGRPRPRNKEERITAFEEDFHRQTVDVKWTQEVGQKIRAEALPALAATVTGVALDSVECRETMCRVVVVHDGRDSQRSMARDISRIPPFDGEVYYSYDSRAQPLRTVMYVMRNGQR